MTQDNPIKLPPIDFCDDKDWYRLLDGPEPKPIKPPYIDDENPTDGSDCDCFLDECVDALIAEIARVWDPEGVSAIVASMLEAKAAQLKPKRGRPPGSRNKNRAPAGSPSTRARRKREERERAEEERAMLDALVNAYEASRRE